MSREAKGGKQFLLAWKRNYKPAKALRLGDKIDQPQGDSDIFFTNWEKDNSSQVWEEIRLAQAPGLSSGEGVIAAVSGNADADDNGKITIPDTCLPRREDLGGQADPGQDTRKNNAPRTRFPESHLPPETQGVFKPAATPRAGG